MTSADFGFFLHGHKMMFCSSRGRTYFFIMDYKEQLRDPRWQKKRLEIFDRDKWTCQICLDTKENLQIHHKSYDKGKKAWEYGNDRLITLCETCHEAVSAHIKEYGNEEEFAVLKIRNEGRKPISIIYSKGNIVFSQEIQGIKEDTVHKLVQFLINNWAKNE